MKFSTRTTYGLRAICCLARNNGPEMLSLPTIAKEERISLPYLERIFAQLKKVGLVEAEKGTTGGYRLSRPASQISVYDVVKEMEGSLAVFHCLKDGAQPVCRQAGHCGASRALVAVQSAVSKTLRGIKLSDLL